jgi:hypothetical protein|tara:strand:- start:50 stop:910 length:861 start_codon:yes stop_codon:yes gene_type:complete
MKNVNIVCTSKPGDGLLHYSYEYCCFLNDLGVNAKLIIIPNKKHTEQDYIDAINECYIKFENIIFNNYMPRSDDVTLIMGRSMLTLAYLDYNSYTEEQKLTLHSLFDGKLISVYSENHVKEYPIALNFYEPDKVIDLCDHEVYVNGVGDQFEKIINFSIYKPVVDNIQFKYLFLGTNKIYYREVEKHIKNYSSHGIIAYKDKYINQKYNHLFVPVKNLLGLFDTYVYTKPNFDPAPRIIQECKWLGKEVIYLRDKSIKDGGPVYWKRPAICLTKTDKIEPILKHLR